MALLGLSAPEPAAAAAPTEVGDPVDAGTPGSPDGPTRDAGPGGDGVPHEGGAAAPGTETSRKPATKARKGSVHEVILPPRPPKMLVVDDLGGDSGGRVLLRWRISRDDGRNRRSVLSYTVETSAAGGGPWRSVASAPAGLGRYRHEVTRTLRLYRLVRQELRARPKELARMLTAVLDEVRRRTKAESVPEKRAGLLREARDLAAALGLKPQQDPVLAGRLDTIFHKYASSVRSIRRMADQQSRKTWWYRVCAVGRAGRSTCATAKGAGAVNLYNPKKTALLAFILLCTGLFLFFLLRVKHAKKETFVRRIPGIDAIEEAIGRATEMGRPVLYVPGIDEMTEVQTIASMLILSKVAETVARYDCEIVVPCRIPFVMTVAEEVVREAFTRAGRQEAHKPENVFFVSDEQFAYAAGVNGLMLRQRPAANLYMGSFFAESLLLAETGFQAKAIQVAGTAQVTQLPFFIAACDYTLIGEELFAASAYLSREPQILSTLKAADWAKVVFVLLVLLGTLLATIGIWPGFPALFSLG